MSNKPFCTVPNRPRGMALVMTLAMLVLVTFAIVAFFSKATNNRQVENSSVGGARAEVFARSVGEAIVGELQKEIIAGSDTTSTTPDTYGNYVLRPKTAQDAVPRVIVTDAIGSPLPAKFNNLVKQSVSAKPFFSGGTPASTLQAVAVKTSEPSADGRVVSLNRWNRPQLIGDATGSMGFDNPSQVPEWVMVTRGGIAPTVTMADAKNSASSNYVIGRFAYNIYNEGGLLDINVAGYPKDLSTLARAAELKIIKGSLAGADLTQIPGVPDQTAVDKLIDWRNNAGIAYYSTVEPTSFSGYTKLVTQFSGTTGYLQRWINDSLTASDQRFISRQDLIRFIQESGQSTITASALPFLGTFSRSLNQPSYWPDPNRPKVMGPQYPGTGSTYSGGNSAVTPAGENLADLINPVFRKIRVSTTKAGGRNDGSDLIEGEPLVKKRFALSRLCWITCDGPSKNASTQVRNAYTKLGVPEQLLDEGTAANIRKYFGLTWTPGPGSGGKGGYWVYNNGVANTIGTLDVVAKAGREADFFELIKAAVMVGSIAKGNDNVGINIPSIQPSYELKDNTRVDNQIVQIGANIIDQSAPDSFPTRIIFDDGVAARSYWGVDDLPYFYGIVNLAIMVKKANPSVSKYDAVVSTDAGYMPLVDGGAIAAVQVPTIWNPHSQPATAVGAGLAPTDLRICVSNYSITAPNTLSTTPNSFYYQVLPWYQDAAGKKTFGTTIRPNWYLGSYQAAKGTIDMPGPGTAGNTAMIFNNSTTLYREPTPLMRKDIPAGSGLRVDTNNYLITSGNGFDENGIPELSTGNKFIGMYIGQFPQRWTATAGGTTTIYTANQLWNQNSGFGITYSLEYNLGGNWIPYQQALLSGGFSPPLIPYDCIANSSDNNAKPALDTWSIGTRPGMIPWDPRSRRWSIIGDVQMGAFLDSGAKTMTQTVRPNGGTGFGSHGFNLGGMSKDGNIGRVSNTALMITDASAYLLDPDGMVRRGMGAYVPGGVSATTTIGMPLATVYGNSANASNRPVLLHRPFRNVAELGYVFSDTPWRNLDFFTPESGNAALLDLFCINVDNSPNALIAGKVDLNTKQARVIQAVLAGAYRDEFGTGATTLAATEAAPVANALVSWTGSSATGRGPLSNISELVGRYGSGFQNGAISPAPSMPYDGFSKDIVGRYTGGSTSVNNLVSRFCETTMRALSDSGQAGTWNLLIDVVAQTGRYPGKAKELKEFAVEGERRFWIHVAIDRQTGAVIDKQVEVVNE